MTLSDFISIASLLSLVYFCYGTWRIDRTLTKVEVHLHKINALLHEWRRNDP